MKTTVRSIFLLLPLLTACREPAAPDRFTTSARFSSPDQAANLVRSTTTDPATTWKFPLPSSGLSVRGDGAFLEGDRSVYADGVCGTSGRLFATTAGSNSGDATLTLGADRRCVNSPRSLTLSYDDGVVETSGGGTFLNLHDVENTYRWMPIGSTARRFLAIHYTPRCSALQFGKDANSDSVLVTRTDAHTWRAVSQPAPNDRAFCTTTGRSYHMQVDLIVVSSRDVP